MARVHDGATAMDGNNAAATNAEKEAGRPSGPQHMFVEDDSRGLLEALMTGADMEHDETEFGVRCRHVPTAPPVTTLEQFISGYPWHCLRECRDGMPLYACVIAVVCARVMIQRQVVQVCPLPSGSNMKQHFQALPYNGDGFGWFVLHTCLEQFVNVGSVSGTSFLFMCWYRCLNKPGFWRAFAAYILVSICITSIFLISVRWTPSMIELEMVPELLGACLSIGYLAVVIKQIPSRLFSWKRKIFLATALPVGGMFQQVFVNLIKMNINASDYTKLGILLAPPLAYNLLLVPCIRMVERSVIHCDASVKGFLQGMVSLYEKLFRRLLLVSMKDPTVVLIASACSALLRMVISLMYGEEDWRVYAFFATRLKNKVSEPMQNVHLPAYNWTSARNAAYQTSCLVINSTMDITLILVLAVWRIVGGIADGEGVDFSYLAVLKNMTMQLVFTMALQAGIAAYLTLYLKVDFIAYARLKCQGWSALMCVLFLLPYFGTFISFVPLILCVSPSGRGPSIHFCQ